MASERWAQVAEVGASLVFLWAMIRQFLPYQIETYMHKCNKKLMHIFHPYMEITFSEYSGDRLKRSEAYTAIEAYLTASCTQRAQYLKADIGRDSTDLVFSMDDYEEVTDDIGGTKVWWYSHKTLPENPTFSFYPVPEDRRYYRLTFHRNHREMILGSYLPHLIEKGKAIKVQKRQRKLFTNSSNYDQYEYKKLAWSHVPFEHPATFDTLAMDLDKKSELIEDLLNFSMSKDYYLKVGKPWKRGYLLYGPPGTGKSTLIAAMANLLDYDVYDLELTSVKNNTALKKLLIETTNKSIIVIEDIDCSLDLSGKRKSKQGEASEEEKEGSKVTLSGLLNFIDGLWSSCGGERLIIFTTNHVDKIDPALIRRGRMDVHVNMSYCTYQGFKVLAKNYLGIKSHALFDDIEELMEKKEISPADVAENLMPKTLAGVGNGQIEVRLKNLIGALKNCKSKAIEKKEEEN